MRLIDADYLLDVLRVHEDEWDTPDETWRPESEYAGAIKAAETVPAIVPVRCHECVRDGHCEAQFFIGYSGMCYCSRGVRKEGQ